MKGKAEGAGEQRAVLRWGMRRLVLVSVVMVCSMLAAVLSSDTFTLFSVSPAHSLFHISSGLSLSSTSSSSTSSSTKSSTSSTSASSSRNSSTSSSSSSTRKASRSAAASGCHYTVGKWVKSDRKPLYSGSTCKRWLSDMWACRLMPGRPNFNYENFRWQPSGCNLPKFNSDVFLARMQNKVVAFVGDSIGRQQYQSLMCMLTGGDDEALVKDVSKEFGLVKQRGAIRADGTAQRFIKTNTTVLYYWSVSLCEIHPLNKLDRNAGYAMHLDRPATFIRSYLKVMDVLIINTGHHWNRGKLEANKWVMHVNGKPNTSKRYQRMASARELTVHKVVAWLHNQKENNLTRADIYMRSMSPRHFFNGDWDSGGRCDDDFIPAMQGNVTGPGSDPVVESAISGTSLRLLNITHVSQFRFDAHVSKYRPKQSGQDCLHWCLPGVPDVWNELLYADIISRKEKRRGA